MSRRLSTFRLLAILIASLVSSAPLSIDEATAAEPTGVIVYQSDFGQKDGAVSAMRGVAYTVDPTLRLENLTHEIPAFNIWEGAYRLNTTASYWPAGTVFVSVVDPGVGTDRKSVVLLTKSGHYFVTPDNGTLTLVAESLGIGEIREIDEATNRLAGSEQSYTFHGRDVYSYTAARLASRQIRFEEIGPVLPADVTSIAYQQPEFTGQSLVGTIPILDIQFGNIWTNIDRATFEEMGIGKGDELAIAILEGEQIVFEGRVPYVSTFGDVPEGEPLAYLNSVNNLSFAINWGNFAETHGISSGADWRVEVTRP